MSGDMNVGPALAISLNVLKAANFAGNDRNIDHFEQFRTIITCCQKLTTTPNALLPPCLTELAEELLKTLARLKLTQLDAMSLCGVAFAFTLTLIADSSSVAMMYSKTFIPFRENSELFVKLSKASESLRIEINSADSFRLCLCHGLLQANDSFWKSQVNWSGLFSRMFPIMEIKCLTYSRLTLLSFKCMVAWCRRVRTTLVHLPCEFGMRIMNIVATNWENPLTGVREQNSLLLEQLLLLTDQKNSRTDQILAPLDPYSLLDLILAELSWMSKSKYFFLSVIIPKAGNIKSVMKYSEDIVHGLTTSLCYTHLAPAGADLYRVCIDSISLDQWEQTFLKPIVNILTTSKYTLQKQNFFNYWMAPTTKKYKLALQILYDALLEVNPKNVIFPVVCCLKTGRKEGYDSMKWSAICSSPYLSKALRHADEMTRAQGFATICHSPKTSVFPTNEEFTAVETFLVENITADSAPLRHSLLNSFTTFLCRTRDSCLQILRAKYNHHIEPNYMENQTLSRSMVFFEWLYNFLRSNLEIGTNYQRKITSLELYKIVLSHLSNESSRKSNSKSDGQRVMKYALAVGKWGFTSDQSSESLMYCVCDENEEVRECAATLLITHFKMTENEINRFKKLFKNGLSLCSDPMFYIAESGALMVYVVTCLAYKNTIGDAKVLVNEETVLGHLLNIAEIQATQLQKDILASVTRGSPLHGILRAIDRLANSTSSPEYGQLRHSETLRLVTLIESVTKHLLKILASSSDKLTDYAPSFLEMGEAINLAIEQSAVDVEESDKYHLSPAHQLVLNTIWLNLKACCILSSRLHKQHGCDSNRCLAIIASVLKQTRHKGALESAGTALGFLTKAMTEEGLVEELEKTLDEALDSLSKGETTSTRGAGIVVLIHKLVANDTRPNKPLLEKCLNHALNLAETQTGDVAQAMHILGVLLKDSSLSQDVAGITHRLTEACFNSINHPSWAVRNTGLQLFGAIVPKLIGQRKQSDEDTSCSCYHLPYEELYYHANTLLAILVDKLEQGSNCPLSETIAVHSSLIPLLTLLSNLSVGLLTIIDRSLENSFNKFVGCFQSLMSSNVFKVRQLAAKSNAWFCSLSQIPRLIRTRVWKIVAYVKDKTLQNEIKSENGLHGFLLNTLYLYNRFNEEKQGISGLREQEGIINECIDELRTIRNAKNINYICWAVFEKIVGFNKTESAREQMEKLNIKLPESIGYSLWISVVAKQIIEFSPLNELLPSLNVALESNYEVSKSALEALRSRIDRNDFEAVSNGTVKALLKFINKQISTEALTVLMDILMKYKEVSTNIELPPVIENLCSDGKDLSVAVACGLLLLEPDPEPKLIENIVDKLEIISNCAKNEESRILGAKGLTLLSPILLKSAADESFFESRSRIWNLAVDLLQDECSEVRTTVSNFTTSLIEGPPLEEPVNPFVSLQFLFNDKTMTSIFPIEYSTSCLWERLKCTETEKESLLSTSLNPFDSRDSNYQERVKVTEKAFQCLKTLLECNRESKIYFLKRAVLPYMPDLKAQSMRFLEFSEMQSSNKKILINSSWYIVAKKLGFQYQIINSLNNSTQGVNLPDLTFAMYSCKI